MSPMIACEMGIIAPAPRPWMARKAMSSVMPFAWPHRADPTTKMPMPSA